MNNILFTIGNLNCEVEMDLEQSTRCLQSIIPKGYC